MLIPTSKGDLGAISWPPGKQASKQARGVHLNVMTRQLTYTYWMDSYHPMHALAGSKKFLAHLAALCPPRCRQP
eukprot:3997481-Pleurochrysis_carterae.AAC.1